MVMTTLEYKDKKIGVAEMGFVEGGCYIPKGYVMVLAMWEALTVDDLKAADEWGMSWEIYRNMPETQEKLKHIAKQLKVSVDVGDDSYPNQSPLIIDVSPYTIWVHPLVGLMYAQLFEGDFNAWFKTEYIHTLEMVHLQDQNELSYLSPYQTYEEEPTPLTPESTEMEDKVSQLTPEGALQCTQALSNMVEVIESGILTESEVRHVVDAILRCFSIPIDMSAREEESSD